MCLNLNGKSNMYIFFEKKGYATLLIMNWESPYLKKKIHQTLSKLEKEKKVLLSRLRQKISCEKSFHKTKCLYNVTTL